jgi:hypothetical protein
MADSLSILTEKSNRIWTTPPNDLSPLPQKIDAALAQIKNAWPKLYQALTLINSGSASIQMRLIHGARLIQAGALTLPGQAYSMPLPGLESWSHEIARCRGNVLTPYSRQQPDLLWCSCLDYDLGHHSQTFGRLHPLHQIPGAPALATGQVLCPDVAAVLLAAKIQSIP